MNKINVTVLDVCGLYPAMRAVQLSTMEKRLPNKMYSYRFYYEPTQFEEWNDSYTFTYDYKDRLDKKDVDLLHKSMLHSDEHAIMLKGVMVYVEITSPILWITEFEHYTGGKYRISSLNVTNPDCELPEFQILSGVYVFSYQTLRHIYCHKNENNSPGWVDFCNFIRTLPLAKELIIGC